MDIDEKLKGKNLERQKVEALSKAKIFNKNQRCRDKVLLLRDALISIRAIFVNFFIIHI